MGPPDKAGDDELRGWRSRRRPAISRRHMRAPILACKDVRLADGPLMLFDGVDLALDARVRACLVGRNGAGKSTLLRILAGEVLPDDGERTVTPGARIAFVPQEPQIAGGSLLDH